MNIFRPLAVMQALDYNRGMEKYIRKCPGCKSEVMHTSERSRDQCESEQRLCRSCGAKQRIKKFGNNEKFLAHTEKGCHTGEENPFYGKKHSEETRRKFKIRDTSYRKESWYRDLMSQAMGGSKNPMFGKSVYETWIETHGVKIANELLAKWKKKQSVNSSGSRNPMYGKPAPQGSGNGWSGWYREFFFRSLKELSYIVDLDKKRITWTTAENIRIKYVSWDGVERNYLPDFVVGNLLIEIKPTRLMSSKIVMLKQAAAEHYCAENSMIYSVIDPVVLSHEEIKTLRLTKVIRFTDRYEKLFMEKYNVDNLDR